MGESSMVTAKWAIMQPADETLTECAAGSECCNPQHSGRPGIAFGYWTFNSINVRACSRECAEKIAWHINERFKSLDSEPSLNTYSGTERN